MYTRTIGRIFIILITILSIKLVIVAISHYMLPLSLLYYESLLFSARFYKSKQACQHALQLVRLLFIILGSLVDEITIEAMSCWWLSARRRQAMVWGSQPGSSVWLTTFYSMPSLQWRDKNKKQSMLGIVFVILSLGITINPNLLTPLNWL